MGLMSSPELIRFFLIEFYFLTILSFNIELIKNLFLNISNQLSHIILLK